MFQAESITDLIKEFFGVRFHWKAYKILIDKGIGNYYTKQQTLLQTGENTRST